MYFRSQSRQSLRQANRFAPWYATLNAALQGLADGILQPAIVLAAIAFLLGGSNTQVALFTTISLATWALAPLVLQGIRLAASRQYPVVFVLAIARLLAVLVIGIIGVRVDNMSTSRLVSILVAAYLFYQVTSALTVQASARLVVGSAARGTAARILRQRWLTAIVGSIIAASVAWSVLAADTSFQRSVGQLLILASLAVVSGTWLLLQIPGGRIAAQGSPARYLGSSLREAARSAPFRRYASYKALLGLVAGVDPFLVVFGFRELGMDVAYIGLALVAYTVGQAGGALLWPRWLARRSPRVPFQVAALLRLVLLIWAVSLPGIAASGLYTDRFDDGTAAMRAFALSFALLGIAVSAGNASNQRYLAQISRQGTPHGMIVSANLLAAVTAFAPLGAAWLLGTYSLERVLWGAAAVAVAALLASGLLVESRVRVRTPIGSWRTSRQAARSA